MKILFLHGWKSVPGGVKPTFLAKHGHTVLNPKLPDEDFEEAVRIAQIEYNENQPDVVVGSSRGGAVAVNLKSGETPLVLLCPAWKKYGTATTVKANTAILHSRADDVIPFEDSEELIANSGLSAESLIEVGNDHRLADPEPLAEMLEMCRKLTKKIQHKPSVSNSKFQLIDLVEIDGVSVVRFDDLNYLITESSQIEQLETELISAIHGNPRVVILDFQSKDFIPAAIIEHVFVKLHKRLNGRMRMCHLPPMVMDHFQMNKLSTLFQIDTTLKGSIDSVKSD